MSQLDLFGDAPKTPVKPVLRPNPPKVAPETHLSEKRHHISDRPYQAIRLGPTTTFIWNLDA